MSLLGVTSYRLILGYRVSSLQKLSRDYRAPVLELRVPVGLLVCEPRDVGAGFREGLLRRLVASRRVSARWLPIRPTPGIRGERPDAFA